MWGKRTILPNSNTYHGSWMLTGMMFVRETRQGGLNATVYAVPLGTASIVLLWLFVGRPFVARRRRLLLLLRRLIDVTVQQWRALIFVIGVHAVPRCAIFIRRPVQSLARGHVAHGRMRRVRYLFATTFIYLYNAMRGVWREFCVAGVLEVKNHLLLYTRDIGGH